MPNWNKSYHNIHSGASAASGAGPIPKQWLIIQLGQQEWLLLFLFLLQVHSRGSGRPRLAAHQSQVVATAKAVLQEQAGSQGAQLAMGDDGDAVTQHVSFIHVVGGENDCAAWKKAEISWCLLLVLWAWLLCVIQSNVIIQERIWNY